MFILPVVSATVNAPSTSIPPSKEARPTTSSASLIVVTPVISNVPLTVASPVMFVSVCNSIVPVPAASNSSGLFVLTVSILLPLICTSSTFNCPMLTNDAYNLFQGFVVLPRSYLSASSGIRLDSKSAATVIASVSASPIVMLPPILTLPVTSKFPARFVSPVTVKVCPTVTVPLTSVSALKLIFDVPEGVRFISPVIVEILLPANLRFPVSILNGSTVLVLTPLTKLIPVRVVTSNVPPWNVVFPVCWSTVKCAPILKSPRWSTVE